MGKTSCHDSGIRRGIDQLGFGVLAIGLFLPPPPYYGELQWLHLAVCYKSFLFSPHSISSVWALYHEGYWQMIGKHRTLGRRHRRGREPVFPCKLQASFSIVFYCLLKLMRFPMTVNRLTSRSPSNSVIQHVPHKAVHSLDLPGQCILLLRDTWLPIPFRCCHLGKSRKTGDH